MESRHNILGYPSRAQQFIEHTITGALTIMPAVQLMRSFLGTAFEDTALDRAAWFSAMASTLLMYRRGADNFGARSQSEATQQSMIFLNQSPFEAADLCLFSSRSAVRASHVKTRTNVGLIVAALTTSFILAQSSVRDSICISAAAFFILAVLGNCVYELAQSVKADFGADTRATAARNGPY